MDADNFAYAKPKLPGISRREGLVVLVKRIVLSQDMMRRLAEENFSRRGHIKLVAYDDLLDQAQIVYKNMLERPILIRAREQKRI